MISEAPLPPPSPMKVAMPKDLGVLLPELMSKIDDLPLASEDKQSLTTTLDFLDSESDEEEQHKALLLQNAILRNEHMQLKNLALHKENEQMKELIRSRPLPLAYQGLGPSAWMPWPGGQSPTTTSVGGYSFGSDATTSSFGSNPERRASHSSQPQILEDPTPENERTTVMMRNIPNNYTREMLFNLLNDRGFKKKYDLVYLPVDFKKKVGLGYAFINFVDHEVAASFWDVFHGFNKWIAQSDKVCEVTWSDALQGRRANIERYRNSPIMHESVPDLCKPVLFDGNGEMEPFPPPTKRIRPPREWRIE